MKAIASAPAKMILFGEHSRFETPDNGRGILSAVVVDVDDISGQAKEIFPVYYLESE